MLNLVKWEVFSVHKKSKRCFEICMMNTLKLPLFVVYCEFMYVWMIGMLGGIEVVGLIL